MAEALASDVVEDAHDLPHNFGAELRRAGNDLLDGDALLQRIDAPQVTPEEFLVDHGDPHARCGVLRSEAAALDDIDAEGLEVVWRDRLEVDRRTFGRIAIGGPADETEIHIITGPAKGQAGYRGDRRDSRHSTDGSQHLLVIRIHLGGGSEASMRLKKHKGEHVVGLNTEVDPREVQKLWMARPAPASNDRARLNS